jgi:Plants and Prokaryotes Conserved (PCC) domain
MSPYDHPVQKANRARPIVIADGEINPAMWNPKLTVVRQSKVRAAHPHRLRAIVDSIQLSDGAYRRNCGLDEESQIFHAHVVLGKQDGSTCGGHLIEARVRPTLEVVVKESPDHLIRRFDRESGLALICPEENP